MEYGASCCANFRKIPSFSGINGLEIAIMAAVTLRCEGRGRMVTGGQNLRTLREKLGLTMRDIETASERIARKHDNEEYLIPISRLSDFETKGVIPSIYRLYSLAVVYRRDLKELLSWYGIDLNIPISDLQTAAPPRSHLSRALANIQTVQMPVRMDPGFDPRKTMNFGRMVEQWGTVPLIYLEEFSKVEFTYGYVGSEDLTMYPILPPGSFIQVDESLNKVLDGGWRSEYERPIYFIETREGHVCCWCTLGREEIILQSHPLSPVPPRVVRHSHAEIVGQVVGVAMRLGEWRSVPDSAPVPKERAALN
jgi:transcriptional regulator with XRE-family HTH domain